jgi:hypothetical protein
MLVGGKSQDPVALPLGKSQYLLYRGWMGPRAGLDRCGKITPPLGFDFRTVQLEA